MMGFVKVFGELVIFYNCIWIVSVKGKFLNRNMGVGRIRYYFLINMNINRIILIRVGILGSCVK